MRRIPWVNADNGRQGKCGDGKSGGDVKASDDFSGLDVNSDGKLSKTEFSAFGNNAFKMKDANANGKIENDEYYIKK